MIGRSSFLFETDLESRKAEISDLVSQSSFLVVGGAGTIGQAVVKEIFQRSAKRLDVVDISENNLAELVRNLRSSIGYKTKRFRTFAIDVGGIEFQHLINDEPPYDYVLNFSAMKHVRSERDPYTLMRMIQVNVINSINLIQHSIQTGSKKYFYVSTDKAANPANAMGATKKLMEDFSFGFLREI